MLLHDKLSRWWSWVNTQLYKLLPVVDFRKQKHLNHYNKIVLIPTYTVNEQAPVFFFSKKQKPFWADVLTKGFISAEVYAAAIPYCFLAGRGIILDNQKRILLESTFFQREYLYKLRNAIQLIQLKLVSPVKVIHNIIPLLSKLSNNYYHWTIESLTRIALLNEYDKTIKTKYTIVIAANAPAFITDSLKYLLQWPEDKIIKWPDNSSAKAENCLLISYPVTRNQETKMLYAYPLEIYKLLNQLAFRNMQPSDGNNVSSCFIISRAKARFRKLVNELAIQQALSEYQVAVIHLESMCFDEQVQLFQKAKLIIAPHGAGLTNIVYCNPQCIVIELYPQKEAYSQPALFYQITRALDIRHYQYEVAPCNKDNDMIADEMLMGEIKKIVEAHFMATV